LNALNLSRGQLASAVGVHKSLVSRWLAGSVTPTNYNRARISETLAKLKPGFNMALWDRPRPEFDAFFGGTAGGERRDQSSPTLAGPRRPEPQPYATGIASKFPGRRALFVAVGLICAAGVAYWIALHATTTREPASAANRFASAPLDSIAVLPFVNMSGNVKEDYFSDGFSEELVNDLSNVPHLYVASRTSSFAFKGRNDDIESIARALRVQALVEGSVRQAGDRVRITAQLIDGNSGYHLWSATYDRNMVDILSVQDELARAIAAALTHRLVSASAASRPKIDPAVYRLFLEGVHEFDAGPPPQGWRRALAIFKQVTVRAPSFADGFAWLARVVTDLAANFDLAPASDYISASDAAERALSLDRHNTLARAMRAEVEMDTWQWRAAASDLRDLRDQSPNSYFAVAELWNFYLLLGFPDQALAEWQRLSVIDPVRYRNDYQTLWALDDAAHFSEEAVVAQTQLAGRPRDSDRLDLLCRAYAGEGRVTDALAVRERLLGLQVNFDSRLDFQDCDATIALATGNRTVFLKDVRVFEAAYPDGFPFAAGLGVNDVVLGDFEKASNWFERAYERREAGFFRSFYYRGFGQENAFAKYLATADYQTLARKPLFKEWQAEHDQIAAALATRRDPLLLPNAR
jgi:TolB-like protein